jgi:hypothetical protein
VLREVVDVGLAGLREEPMEKHHNSFREQLHVLSPVGFTGSTTRASVG